MFGITVNNDDAIIQSLEYQVSITFAGLAKKLEHSQVVVKQIIAIFPYPFMKSWFKTCLQAKFCVDVSKLTLCITPNIRLKQN